jgi:tRNA A37 N6-isopentenylltransferase MiaA
VGRTAFAHQLAKAFNGEIVSADPLRTYRELNAATGKPTLLQRQEVVHHFIDTHPLSHDLSAGLFAHEADKLCRDIHARGRLPIVSGNSIFFLKTLLEGPNNSPRRDAALEDEVLSPPKPAAPAGLGFHLSLSLLTRCSIGGSACSWRPNTKPWVGRRPSSTSGPSTPWPPPP